MRSWILIGVLTIMSGCTIVRVSEDFTFEPGADHGIIVLSTRIDDRCGGNINTARINFEGLTDDGVQRGMFVLVSPAVPQDFTNPPGSFIAWKLKAGQYRLIEFTKISILGSFRSNKELDMLFNVVPGRISYLGEIYLTLPDCSKFSIRVNDQRQRDSAMFDKKMVHLKSHMFEYHFLKPPEACCLLTRP